MGTATAIPHNSTLQKRPAPEPPLAVSTASTISLYRPFWCCSFGAFCLCGAGLELWCGAGRDAFAFGGFDSCDVAGRSLDGCAEVVPVLPCSGGVESLLAPLFCELFDSGRVNERNPSLELPLFPAVEGPRASLGDIAGA